jgi:hypothetical protein
VNRVLEKTGTPAELAAWGAQLRARGVTGEVSLAEVSPGVVRARVVLPGTVAVRTPAAARRSWAWRMPRWSRWATVGGAVAAAGGVVYEAVQAYLWLREHWAVLVGYTVAALVALLIVWHLLGRAGACPGLHCPGCRCGGR